LGDGYDSTLSRDALKSLDGRHKKILVDKEAVWRQKNRAIWLANGDENTNSSRLMEKGGNLQILFGI
jgi:hypothetical protein